MALVQGATLWSQYGEKLNATATTGGRSGAMRYALCEPALRSTARSTPNAAMIFASGTLA